MTLTSLSRSEHQNLALTKKPNYAFFKKQTFVPLCGVEIKSVIPEIPIFFMQTGNSIRVCGLLGLEENVNLFVSEAGVWELAFFPAILRAYPFGLGELENGNKTLLIPEKNEFLVDRAVGKPLFDQNGDPTELVIAYIKFLSQIKLDLKKLEKTCLLLKELDILEPFSIEVNKGNAGSTAGRVSWQLKPEDAAKSMMLRIRPESFDEINDDAFLEMRKSGLLSLIYAHFHSLGNITKLLGKMGTRRKEISNLKNLGTKIFGEGNDELNFNFSDF